jgi:3-deoxy-D-manno-octulosonic-acid transferase
MHGSNSFSAEFSERFNISGSTPLLIAASTHAPEEILILDALAQVSRRDLRLILAPRHPERFGEVAALLDKSRRPWTRRSSPPNSRDKNSSVILLDTIGELSLLYSLATLVFVGGSISQTGGHNILEPAAVGSAIITGPHTFNFADITRDFVKAKAIVQLSSGDLRESTKELSAAINDLLANEAHRSELQQKAKDLVQRNLGATERTIGYLNSLLMGSSEN